MRKKIAFSKMVATGNDFVVIDNRKLSIGSNRSGMAKNLCRRKAGIGADGLLLIEKSKIADFRMRIFNPDGSEPEMCGNGSRCIALYARVNKIASSPMTIETRAGILSAKVSKELVKINMTEPEDIKLGIELELEAETCQLHYINTGVPHIVYFVDDIDRAEVYSQGRQIRYHKAFTPAGTNVNFVQAKKRGAIFIRTYERGVEAETLACGTGSVASAIISSIIKEHRSPVKVHTKGGDLSIYFKQKENGFTDVFLEGEAKEVFRGVLKD